MADIVTSENRAEFMASRVKTREIPPEKPPEDAKPVEQPVEPKQEKQHPIKERFSEIAAARRLAEQREQEARDEARRYREELDALKAAKNPPVTATRPDPKNFADQAAYEDALVDWRVSEKLKEKEQSDRIAAQKAESDRLSRAWQSKIRKASEEIEDYDEVMASANLPITQELGLALLKSDIGPRIQYYLAQHPSELEELREMPTDDMLRRFGKLEAKLENEVKAGEKQAKTVVVDKKSADREESKPIRRIQEPPEPITPLNGTNVAAGSGIVDADGNVTGSFRDYKAARRAGKIK